MGRRVFLTGERLTDLEYLQIVASGVFTNGEVISADKVNEEFNRIFGDEMTPLYDLLDEVDRA